MHTDSWRPGPGTFTPSPIGWINWWERDLAEPVTVNWFRSRLLQRRIGQQPVEAFSELLSEHGECVRFFRGNRRVALLGTPELAMQLLTSSDFQKTRKRRPVFGEGLVTAEGEKWRAQRELGQAFVQRLSAEENHGARSAEIMDRAIGEWRSRPSACLFSRVSRLNLCLSFQMLLGRQPTSPQMDAFLSCLDVLIRRRPTLSERVQPWSSYAKNYRRAQSEYRSLIEEWIRSTEGDDNLVGFLRAELPKKGVRIPLFDQVSTYILASSDTSASALTSAIFLLSGRDEIQKEIREGNEELARRFFREAMRLYPPVWMISREAKVPTSLGSVSFARGDQAVIVPFLIHRDGRFWEEPSAFRPDRWKAPPQRGTYLPFGFGPRACVGAQLVLQQAVQLLTRLTRLARPVAGNGELRPSYHFTLRPECPPVEFLDIAPFVATPPASG